MKSYSKRMKWERILSYIMLLIVTTMLFSCGDANYISPVELGQKQNKIIMEALKAKDKEKLKKVLAKAMQNQENIDEEIDNLMNFIDRNIISYDIGGVSSPSGKSDEKGWIYRVYDGETENIVTDTGKKYELEYFMYYVNRNHKDYEGVFQVWLENTEIYTEENDYPSNGVYGICLNKEGDEE